MKKIKNFWKKICVFVLGIAIVAGCVLFLHFVNKNTQKTSAKENEPKQEQTEEKSIEDLWEKQEEIEKKIEDLQKEIEDFPKKFFDYEIPINP